MVDDQNLHELDNPVGIDLRIQEIQNYLYSGIKEWKVEAFGRAELIGNRLMLFSEERDYTDALVINDSKSNGRFFFIDSEKTIERFSQLVTEVTVVFLLNLEKVYKEKKHRLDEEARIKVLELLKCKGLEDLRVVKGQSVLKGYETSLIDMQPYHFMSFTFDLNYSIHNNHYFKN